MVAFLGITFSPASYAQGEGYDACFANCINDQTGVCMKSKLLEERISNEVYKDLHTPEELCEQCCRKAPSPVNGSTLSE